MIGLCAERRHRRLGLLVHPRLPNSLSRPLLPCDRACGVWHAIDRCATGYTWSGRKSSTILRFAKLSLQWRPQQGLLPFHRCTAGFTWSGRKSNTTTRHHTYTRRTRSNRTTRRTRSNRSTRTARRPRPYRPSRRSRPSRGAWRSRQKNAQGIERRTCPHCRAGSIGAVGDNRRFRGHVRLVDDERQMPKGRGLRMENEHVQLRCHCSTASPCSPLPTRGKYA